MKIEYSTRFMKMYGKLRKIDQEKVDYAIERFKSDPFDPRLQNHKLLGDQKNVRSLSAGFDLRILYVEKDGHALIIFVKVGTHDAVY